MCNTRNTFSYGFYARSSKVSKKTKMAPVELSFVANGKRVFINLPYRVRMEDWNKKHRPKEIEDYLSAQRQIVSKVLTEMAENGIPVTAETLRDYFRTGGVKSYTVEDLFTEYLSIQKQRVPKSLSQGVYRKYELVRDLFFTQSKKESEVSSITNYTVRKFFTFLDSKYDNSTAVGYKTKFKSFITFALDNNKLKVNPMQGIKIEKKKKPLVFLTEEEIRKIIDTPIENKSLSRVRDAFVLQLSTGLAYADILALRKEDIHITSDGTHYISKPRVKTGTTYTTVILKEGVEVLKRNDYQLTIISNQKSNAYLRAIQGLCGIDKHLTTHLARKTFGQRLLSSGVRMETVSKALGHSSTKITQTYYCDLQSDSVIKEITSIMA